MTPSEISRVHRHLKLDLSADAEYYKNECAIMASQVAQLSRENKALRARVDPLSQRVHDLELELGALLKE
jgi:cell division protein FtsB